MPYFGIFRLEFEITIVIFDINTFELVQLQNYVKRQKCLNVEPEMPDLGIFGLELENNIVIFEISTLEFV